jgi:hypothetical protein
MSPGVGGVKTTIEPPQALDTMRLAPACSLSVTIDHLRPRAAVPPPEPSDRRQWLVDDVMDVTIEAAGAWEPEETQTVPAVVLRMPAHAARHLACVLDDWSTIGRLLESARGADERDLAGVLHEAARAAEALRAEAS